MHATSNDGHDDEASTLREMFRLPVVRDLCILYSLNIPPFGLT